MRILLLTLILFTGRLAAAAPIPTNSLEYGQAPVQSFTVTLFVKGAAIYLDSDGVGAWVGGNGSAVLGVRIVVTSFDPATHILAFQMTEQGKVQGTGTLNYDPAAHLLISEHEGNKFDLRKAGPLVVQLRKSLGLEQRQAP